MRTYNKPEVSSRWCAWLCRVLELQFSVRLVNLQGRSLVRREELGMGRVPNVNLGEKAQSAAGTIRLCGWHRPVTLACSGT